MSFEKEIITYIKKIGFQLYKDFHQGVYILDRGIDILPCIEIRESNQKRVQFELSFIVRKKEGYIKYISGSQSHNEYGYISTLAYIFTEKGVFVDYSSVEAIEFQGWSIFQKEKFFDSLDKNFMPFIEKMIDKETFFIINLDKSIQRFLISYYEENNFIKEAIDILDNLVNQESKGTIDTSKLRNITYLEYLKNHIPLPLLVDPYDKTTIIDCEGNDIYLLLNKKTAKDIEILEYFGEVKSFSKPQKINYSDLNSESSIAICKVGKWSVVKIGVELFMQFDQEKIENILSELSTKYSRAILFINQDTSAIFGFEVYKKGELLRRWMVGDGEVLENIGKPITGEKKRFSNSLQDEQTEESIVDFLDTVLKITYGDLEKSKSLLYE